MNTPLTLALSAADWLSFFMHFCSLSLLSIGGAISTTTDMHRFLVDQQGWLTDGQFSASVAIAQAAPGPNVLFVALMGWHVGLNAGSMVYGFLGVALSMFGILAPSTILTYNAAQWGHRNRELRAVRAFKQGMAPIVVSLLIATGWVLAGATGTDWSHWPSWLLTVVVALIVWRTKIHLLWLLGAGALLGGFGLI